MTAPHTPNLAQDAIAERLQAVIDAHGGTARWQAVERIEVRLSSGGLAFASKFQAAALKGLLVYGDNLWVRKEKAQHSDIAGVPRY